MILSDYQEIGHYLRDSRESLRVTLDDAARALHIRAKYLAALESGDLNELPGLAYTRGYIRNYVQYLRLDEDEILDAYASLLGPKSQELFIPEPTLRQNIPAPWLTWLSLAGFALVYAYWYFAFHDRTHMDNSVPELSPALAHLLDKPMPMAMDNAWIKCLEGGDVGCYTLLHTQALMPHTEELYDIGVKHDDLQK